MAWFSKNNISSAGKQNKTKHKTTMTFSRENSTISVSSSVKLSDSSFLTNIIVSERMKSQNLASYGERKRGLVKYIAVKHCKCCPYVETPSKREIGLMSSSELW